MKNCGLGRTHHEVGAYPPLPEERITSDLAAFMRLFGVRQQIGHFAFRHPATDGFGKQRPSAIESAIERFQHLAGDVRNASHQEDISDPDARRTRKPVFDQVRPFRDARHAKPLVVKTAARGVILLQRGPRLGMDHNAHPKSRRNGIHRNVVMGRPDAASREQIIIARTKGVHRFYDGGLIIGHHSHFLQADALDIQPERNLRDILVGGPARKDFIANHDQCGSPDTGLGHGNLLTRQRGQAKCPLAKLPRHTYKNSMTEYVTVTKDSPAARSGAIKLHDDEGFAGMRKAGQLAAEVLDALVPHVIPGVTTEELDDIARDHMLRGGGVPATLGYRGYTHSCCISINNVICHGIPGPKPLKDGDIANIDVTVIVDGWHGDTSRMFIVGDAPIKAKRLVDVTYECLMLGIEQAKPGNTMGDIGYAIQRHAEKYRYGVVRDFCGHGLGRVFHDAPEVVHVGRPGIGPELKPGMFFTIEPMINIGKPGVKMLEDGWTAVTRDRTLSAQFEHSIGITETGCEIFTKSPAGLDRPPY